MLKTKFRKKILRTIERLYVPDRPSLYLIVKLKIFEIETHS